MEQFGDFWQRILSGQDVTRDEVFLSVLMVGMLFATVHLITMLVTRWGDHKATTKSLIFSIVVHLSCGMGLLAMNFPERSQPEQTEPPAPEDPFRYVDLRLDGIETFQTDQAGNTPLFEKLPRPKEMTLTRREPLPHDLPPVVKPDRKPQPLPPQPIRDPKLPSLPKEATAVPQPADAGYAGVRQQAVVPQQIFDETAPRRAESHNPTQQRQRTDIPRPAQTEERVVREITRGTADEMRKRPSLNRRVALAAPHRKPDSLLRSGQPEPLIRERRSPLRSLLDSKQTGLAARRTTKGTSGSNPRPNRIRRLRTKTIDGNPQGGVERFRPDVTPKSPSPSKRRLLASRTAPQADSLRSGPRPNVPPTHSLPRLKRRSRNLPATYRLRSLANRKATAEKHGGTDASERAVERALAWLSENQHAKGYWDADAFGSGQVDEVQENGVTIRRRFAGKRADTGITALALLAFLGAGYTHEEGRYAKTVEAALEWIISQQRSDGYLGGNASHYAKMYCHGMATYALAEAYGMQSDPTVDTRLREPLQKAVKYTLDMQNPQDGGWRYIKGQASDMSMFGWQLMALKSAEIAGLHIPDDAKQGMVKFLKENSTGRHDGLAAYQKRYRVSAAMTAEALFCKQMFRIPRRHPASREAVEYLMQRLPKRSQLNLYYWYYGTLAMFQYGGPEWKRWNNAMQQALIAEQVTTGDNAGSWDPKGSWGPYGGRVYSTAVSALCLEVYYRFLPLYKISGKSMAE